jgi:Ca-activated chloride channel family protein
VQKLEKDPGIYAKNYSRKHATDLLDYLAQETGGRTFYPPSAAQVTQAAGELVHDLRTQYIIGYSPTKKPKEKDYRKLKVMLARRKESAARTVITRRGYSIPGKPKQQKS